LPKSPVTIPKRPVTFIRNTHWAQSTYGDPVGSIGNWINQFGGQVQSGAQQTISQSSWALAAQGVANGLSAVFGLGGGEPPAAGSDPVLVSPGTGQTALPTTGGTPPNATLSSGSDNSDGSGSDTTSQGSANNSLPMNPSQLSHIFRDDDGHLTDTPQNQQTLLNLVNNPVNSLGTDQFGNQWFAETLPDGTQLWGSVRNGVIQNGGLNTIPRSFNPATGLSKGG
jgi:filamentous hemagglutinin